MDTKWKRAGGAAGLLGAGLIAGGVLAGTLSASADEGTTGTATTASGSAGEAAGDPSQPQRSDEELLTGDTRTQVEEAVLAAHPDATIERSETDSGGVYEAHVLTADGERLTVLVGEDFAVTGTETGGHGGHGGPRGADDGD